MVLGVTGLNPELINRWIDDLPNFKQMQTAGMRGSIQSTVPPVSPVAWTSAFTGRNPGVYGFWGKNFRKDYSYGESEMVNGRVRDQRVRSLYQILPLNGQKVVAINIPQTWPPPRIAGGYMIASQHPDNDISFTWPQTLKEEIEKTVGPYLIDASEDGADYLSRDLDQFDEHLKEMDAQRIKLLPFFMVRKQCDCAIAVLSGLKWIARSCYRKLDSEQRLFDAENLYQSPIYHYYVWLDEKIGTLCNLKLNDTALMVLSENSVQPVNGVFNINEWLIKEGYLVLHDIPSEPTPFDHLKINWTQTKAWSIGSNGQIYLNLKDREAEGIVEPKDYENLLNDLSTKMIAISDDQGNSLRANIVKRSDAYTEPYGQFAPDLFVRFNEGRLKTSDWVGSKTVYSPQLLGEPSDGGEGGYGYFSLIGPRIPATNEQKNLSLLDVASTILDVMDQEIPPEMEGVSRSGIKRSEEEEKALNRDRLSFLGY